MTGLTCAALAVLCVVCVLIANAYQRWLADQPNIPDPRNHEED